MYNTSQQSTEPQHESGQSFDFDSMLIELFPADQFPAYPSSHETITEEHRLSLVLDIRRQLDITCFYYLYILNSSGEEACVVAELFAQYQQLFAACQQVIDYIRIQREMYRDHNLSYWQRFTEFVRVSICRRAEREFSMTDFTAALKPKLAKISTSLAHLRNHLCGNTHISLTARFFLEAVIANFNGEIQKLTRGEILAAIPNQEVLLAPPEKTIAPVNVGEETSLLFHSLQYLLAVCAHFSAYEKYIPAALPPDSTQPGTNQTSQKLTIATLPTGDSYLRPRLRGRECLVAWFSGPPTVILPNLFRQGDIPNYHLEITWLDWSISFAELTVYLRLPVLIGLIKQWWHKISTAYKTIIYGTSYEYKWPSLLSLVSMLLTGIGSLILINVENFFPLADDTATEAFGGTSTGGKIFVDGYVFCLSSLLADITINYCIQKILFAKTGLPYGEILVVKAEGMAQLRNKGLNQLQIVALLDYFRTKWRKFRKQIYPSWYKAAIKHFIDFVKGIFTSRKTDKDKALKQATLETTYQRLNSIMDALQEGRPRLAKAYVKEKLYARKYKIENIEWLLGKMRELDVTGYELQTADKAEKMTVTTRTLEDRFNYLTTKNSLLSLMLQWSDESDVESQTGNLFVFNSFIRQLKALETTGETKDPWRDTKPYYRDGHGFLCRI